MRNSIFRLCSFSPAWNFGELLLPKADSQSDDYEFSPLVLAIAKLPINKTTTGIKSICYPERNQQG